MEPQKIVQARNPVPQWPRAPTKPRQKCWDIVSPPWHPEPEPRAALMAHGWTDTSKRAIGHPTGAHHSLPTPDLILPQAAVFTCMFLTALEG
ncbi:hypothetical protein CHARACLAT_023532 [Characodon lateralis]|uniref:Uncharacterized protein n=1 Tax=Characodon lateralis TaxID=208331 RepID=A0ABU7ELM6_9TELE|nr:hypothetical protein [Characodon lateralis]